MLDKIGHIKNPLSVIAIFAGLAEVSGTVVLPLLEKDIQSLFVWFLMGFPCLLVLLFFITLWNNHSVLYAPSDFTNDQTFAELFTNSSPAAKYIKLQDEIRSDALGENVEPRPTEDSAVAPLTSPQPTEIDHHADTATGSPKIEIELEGLQSRDMIEKVNNLAPNRPFETALVAEELAINRLSQTLDTFFHRNVSIKGIPKTVYDAISLTPQHAILVEVKFTRTGLFAKDNIQSVLLRAKQFSENLPVELQKNFNFKFIVVHAPGAETEKLMKMKFAISAISDNFPFKTDVIFYNYDSLKTDAQSVAEL